MQAWLDRQNGAVIVEGKPESTFMDVVSSSVSYVGKAPAGSLTSNAVWRIFKLTTDTITGSISIMYADGNPNYDNIWDNRASLSYS